MIARRSGPWSQPRDTYSITAARNAQASPWRARSISRLGPPLRWGAACSVSIHRERGFIVAQVLILVPSDVQNVRVRQPYEQLSFTDPTPSPYEAIAWQFVVTRDGATPIASAEAEATKPSDRMAPDVSWTSSGVQRLRSGASRCGNSGGGFGPDGPIVEFISVCPS